MAAPAVIDRAVVRAGRASETELKRIGVTRLAWSTSRFAAGSLCLARHVLKTSESDYSHSHRLISFPLTTAVHQLVQCGFLPVRSCCSNA